MFVIRQKRNPRSIRNGFRVMCISDLHAGAHYGTYAGLSPWDRGLIMSQFLKSEYEREPSFDLFFGNGDMASNEYNELRDRTSYFERLQRTCAPVLTKAGVPAYYIYANHDDLCDDEWRRITGYPKDYIVDLDDDVSFVCLDLYHGPQTPEERAWGYGAPSDMKREIYEETSEHIRFREHVFVVCHFADDARNPLLSKFIRENPQVRATLAGHTHLTRCGLLGGKSRMESGHFSWAAATWGRACDDTAAAMIGPWGMRCLEFDGTKMHSYMIYPEHSYGELSGYGEETGWITVPAFHQPRYTTEHFEGGNHVRIPLE